MGVPTRKMRGFEIENIYPRGCFYSGVLDDFSGTGVGGECPEILKIFHPPEGEGDHEGEMGHVAILNLVGLFEGNNM